MRLAFAFTYELDVEAPKMDEEEEAEKELNRASGRLETLKEGGEK
jgi:hypothetical protein